MRELKDENRISIEKLCHLNITIPAYQRPYEWTSKNVETLLNDMNNVIDEKNKYSNYKYRFGTIILKYNEKEDSYDIIDGQQRFITFLLIHYFLNKDESILHNYAFDNKITQNNIHNNYHFIKDWFNFNKINSKFKDELKNAFEHIFEVIVIVVHEEYEAFQLFDSQNTRGKALEPHDLLKAYHLRSMVNDPYEMRHVVTRWEEFCSNEISTLFNYYLFSIKNWARKEKTHTFTDKDIDTYKGISKYSSYTYSQKAEMSMPYFQITEPFTEGKNFFLMVAHYLEMLKDIKMEISNNFHDIDAILNDKTNNKSTGFNYAKTMFYCALFHYYDKFHNFDKAVVIKLFIWAMMLRCDMENLSFSSINKYAIGEESNYTNQIPIFSIIDNARLHTEISNLQIIIKKKNDNKNEKWNNLYNFLRKLGGINNE